MVTKTIIKDVDSLKNFLISKFISKKPHSFDTETTSADIRKFRKENGLSKPLPKSIDLQALNYYYLEMEGMSLYDGENACYIDFENNPGFIEKAIPILKEFFEKSTGSIIAHNIAFDMKVLKKYGISLENRKIYCTMVADHLLDEEREHGLKKLAKELLGQEETIKYIDARRAGEDVFADYALNDAIWTYDLCMWQQNRMVEEGVVGLFREVEMPFQHCLVEMESTGMYIDTKRVAELRQELKDLKNKYLEEMLDLLDKKPTYQVTLNGDIKISSPINLDSTKVLIDILFTKLGLDIIEKTPGGSPAVGKNTIAALKNKHPFVAVLNRYKIVQKLLSAYFEEDAQIMRNICPDNRVRPYFRDTGTKTGRQSCIAKGTKIQTVRDFSINKEGTNIEDIKPGDLVYCTDGDELKVRRVKRLIKKGKQECIKLKWISVSNKFEGELILTPDHKIKNIMGDWVRADSIEITTKSEIGRNRRFNLEMLPQSRATSLHFQLNKYVFIYYPGIKKGSNIRFLVPGAEHVHHKNGNTLCDIPNNLIGMDQVEHFKLHAQTGGFKDTDSQKKAQDTLKTMRESGLIDYNRNKIEWTKEYCEFIAHKNRGMIKYIILNDKHDFETIKREMTRNGVDLKKIKKLYEETNHHFIGKEYVGLHEVYDLEIESFIGEDTHNFFANEICVHNCSEPNLQQLPKINEDLPIHSRSAFASQEGYSLIVSDFSSQEIRVMAEISKDPTLVEALNNGYDMHLAIANQFYNLGIPKECLMETHSDYELWKKKFKNERTKAKTITFGLAYGKGAYGFSQDFGITEDEAQKIVDDYFNGMPKLRDAIEQSKKEVERFGRVVLLSGRQRHFKKIVNGDWEGYSKKSLRQGFNAMIQGFSADMIRISCNNIYKAKKDHPEWDLKIIATIHDEIVAEVRDEYAKEAAILVQKCMEDSVDFCVPTPAEVDIGKNYNEAK